MVQLNFDQAFTISGLNAFDVLSPATTKGDVVVFDGTTNIRVPLGTSGTVLAFNQDSLTGQVSWLPFTSFVNVHATFTEVTVDTTTTSLAFTDLLTLGVNTGASSALVLTSFSVSNTLSNKPVFLRVLVDGVVKRAASIISNGSNIASSGAIILKSSVTAGDHTVKVQWKILAHPGVAQCRPSSQPETEHVSLLVMEAIA